MDFIDKIGTIAQRIEKVKDKIANEEATKTSFIIPFIEALGYDIYDPDEVFPEFTADIPVLKNDKVDYAIFAEGKPIMLVECKCCHDALDNKKHTAQLHKYYQNTEARFGILTNGIIYRFYTDIDKSHVMDIKPFFEFNILKFSDSDIEELKKFSKNSFDPNALSDTAQNLLYTKEIKRIMSEQLVEPSSDFVKFFASRVYSGRMTASNVEKFTEITKKSLKEFINERIADRLKSAIDSTENGDIALIDEENEIETNQDQNSGDIITTEEELEGFYTVKAILREVVDVSRVKYKDTKNYFGINLDGKVTKTICRLRFNSNRRKYIGIIDPNSKEAKKEINGLDEIYSVGQLLKDRVTLLTKGQYEEKSVEIEQ